MTAPRIAITTGEPAGIGPEVALRAAVEYATEYATEYALECAVASGPLCDLLGDAALLESVARSIGFAWPLPASIRVVHEPLAVPVRAGVPDARNARYVLRLLDRALASWRAGEVAAIATAPVHKAVIQDAGIAFTGHTEYLAAATGTPEVVMMLVGGGLRVALATTHLALAAVPAAITRLRLHAALDILDHDLRARFGIASPRIAVTGLNPHAGEGGHMGREEIDVIAPAIDAARARGIDASGPWPADTVFAAQKRDAARAEAPAEARTDARADAILAMYHDQGLATLKYASFGGGVNVTLGLPLPRTSADHGTAFDIAGRGVADPGSMREAVRLAVELAQRDAGGG